MLRLIGGVVAFIAGTHAQFDEPYFDDLPFLNKPVGKYNPESGKESWRRMGHKKDALPPYQQFNYAKNTFYECNSNNTILDFGEGAVTRYHKWQVFVRQVNWRAKLVDPELRVATRSGEWTRYMVFSGRVWNRPRANAIGVCSAQTPPINEQSLEPFPPLGQGLELVARHRFGMRHYRFMLGFSSTPELSHHGGGYFHDFAFEEYGWGRSGEPIKDVDGWWTFQMDWGEFHCESGGYLMPEDDCPPIERQLGNLHHIRFATHPDVPYTGVFAIEIKRMVSLCFQNPSSSPTIAPTPKPTQYPTFTNPPTLSPTGDPTYEVDPTPFPTPQPTIQPSNKPTPHPTSKPTAKPTPYPTPRPTVPTSKQPTSAPSSAPSLTPTSSPTPVPSWSPKPTPQPTFNASTDMSTVTTPDPTPYPSPEPRQDPTIFPTPMPTSTPTETPTEQPTYSPTLRPTKR